MLDFSTTRRTVARNISHRCRFSSCLKGKTEDQYIDDVKALLMDRIHLVPYFTNKLRAVPFNLDHPVWVKDRVFHRQSRAPARGCGARRSSGAGSGHCFAARAASRPHPAALGSVDSDRSGRWSRRDLQPLSPRLPGRHGGSGHDRHGDGHRPSEPREVEPAPGWVPQSRTTTRTSSSC